MNECPDACKKDLKHLQETDQRLEKENADQWDHINAANKCAKSALAEAVARVSWGHALTALGILVAITLAGFKLIYSQNTTMRTEFSLVKERIVAVETKLDMFQRDMDNAHDHVNR
jgi:hypothetical protein